MKERRHWLIVSLIIVSFFVGIASFNPQGRLAFGVWMVISMSLTVLCLQGLFAAQKRPRKATDLLVEACGLLVGISGFLIPVILKLAANQILSKFGK